MTHGLDNPTGALATFLRDHPGRDLDLGGGLLYHYLDEGAGDPVVMVHGNPSWSFYFRDLAAALSPTHRVVVPDHVGCGLSAKPDDSGYDYTLGRRIGDLEALLVGELDLHGITLVLHDWGGAIGMGFAARHPERIARLVLLNTAGFHLPASKGFPWPLAFCRNSALGALSVRGLNLFCRGAARVGCQRSPMPADIRAGYLAPYDSWDHRIAVHRFVQDIPLRPGDRTFELVTSIQDALRQFADRPVLIGWGLKDFVFDRHFLTEWERRFPSAEIHRFPEAGHYVLEDESAALIPLIRDFLAAHPVPRAVLGA